MPEDLPVIVVIVGSAGLFVLRQSLPIGPCILGLALIYIAAIVLAILGTVRLVRRYTTINFPIWLHIIWLGVRDAFRNGVMKAA